jgi:hypothetical protein
MAGSRLRPKWTPANGSPEAYMPAAFRFPNQPESAPAHIVSLFQKTLTISVAFYKHRLMSGSGRAAVFRHFS